MDTGQARVLDFEIGDSSNNLKLYKGVMNKLGMKQNLDEKFKDYQEIYDETVKCQSEERIEKKWEKGRGR